MTDIEIIDIFDEKYSCCLMVLGSFHDLKVKIDNVVKTKEVDGEILLDTLFHSGNGDDRFYTIQADQGKLNWDTLELQNISKRSEVRKKISKVLAADKHLVLNSTLTNVQKKMVLAGIGI